jgi:MFS family permease
LGATPLLSGIYLLPTAIALSITSILTGIVIRKTGQYRPLIWLGLCFMTLGTGLFIDLSARSSWAKIIIFQIIAGLGVGPNFQAPLIAMQSFVPVSFSSRLYIQALQNLECYRTRLRGLSVRMASAFGTVRLQIYTDFNANSLF